MNSHLSTSIPKLSHKLLSTAVSPLAQSTPFNVPVFHPAVNKVYGCVIQRKDHLINKETGVYDEQEYTAHPNRYTSTFKTQVRSVRVPASSGCTRVSFAVAFISRVNRLALPRVLRCYISSRFSPHLHLVRRAAL